ncbi:hypothetical protein EX895_004439 [Sporisorium graminicola]|uniref:Vta1/callose synthase N-terminal domain-containing protein n=1 Tax=Sporisorium graminicola TaxID=280036 RepID=A0A4U7KU16_9BASI|nr:hypothetical protein EX895_004439 [Sporisorium graminicola]TKY86798.1 hypothetical protein EX895_004439 [Sporisorium graminicola]
MDEPLPNPPAELKAVLPFVQRANELRTADKVIAYWCCYYAAQLGIAGNAKENESKMYLLTLMDTLEELKAKLADNDAVTNDAASAAYVENFALKVFVGADNEDRAGKATRATPKKFLAASQFIELLKIFGTLEPEMHEKIKYAKWKAADIAKAFKEGRKPQAGPAGGDPKLEAATLEAAMGPSTVDSKEEEEYLAREMAKLTTAAPDEPPTNAASGLGMTRGSSSMSNDKALQAPSDFAPESHTLDSASPDAEEMWKSRGKPAAETLSRSSSAQRRDSLDRPQVQPSSSFTSNLGSSPGSRPLPVPPQRDGLPIPPISAHQQLLGSSPGVDQGAGSGGGPGAAPASFWGASAPTLDRDDSAGAPSVLPSVPSDHLPSLGSSGLDSGHPAIERIDPPRSPGIPSLPTTPGMLPGASGAHQGPSIPSVPPTAPTTDSFAPPQPPRPIVPSVAAQTPARPSAPSAPALAPAPAPPAVFPETLDARLSTRVQKLAKGAASAVDFEDLDTARIQLRQALDILEGRTTV